MGSVEILITLVISEEMPHSLYQQSVQCPLTLESSVRGPLTLMVRGKNASYFGLQCCSFLQYWSVKGLQRYHRGSVGKMSHLLVSIEERAPLPTRSGSRVGTVQASSGGKSVHHCLLLREPLAISGLTLVENDYSRGCMGFQGKTLSCLVVCNKQSNNPLEAPKERNH